MISFFKYQDPLRFSMILIILIIIRLPALIYGYPLLIPELTWQLIGEKMGDGFVLYRDIWTSAEPFSAGVYYLLDVLFGKSQFVLQFFSLLLVFIQAIIFNFVLSINNLYPERTYVPGLLYVIFSSLFFEFYTLSPPMLGTTFILMAMHLVFFQIRTSEDDENVFYTGNLIAIASLFYFPFIICIFLAVIAFLFFTGATLRRYFLMLTGFLFPFILVGTYYFVREGLDSFLSSFAMALFSDTELMVSGKALGVALIIPVALLIVSIFAIYSQARYINYQYITIRIFLFWLILSFITLYFTRTLSAFHLFIFVPSLAFFSAHFFLLIRRKLIREIIFAVSVIVILWVNYRVLYQFATNKKPNSYEQMLVKGGPEFSVYKDKKILVLGSERSYYKNNHLATPYLNWDLSQRHFYDLNNYNNVSELYENFVKDMPEVIIDKDTLAEKLFKRLPELGQQYRKVDGKNIFHRIQ